MRKEDRLAGSVPPPLTILQGIHFDVLVGLGKGTLFVLEHVLQGVQGLDADAAAVTSRNASPGWRAYEKMITGIADLREIPRQEQTACLSEAIYATGLADDFAPQEKVSA